MDWSMSKAILMFLGFYLLNMAAAHRIGYWQESRRMIRLGPLSRFVMFIMTTKKKVNLWVIIVQIVNILSLLINVFAYANVLNLNVEDNIMKAISVYPTLFIYFIMAIDLLFVDNSQNFVH